MIEKLFADVHFTAVDNRQDYGEDRYISVGMIQQDVIVVVWTPRHGKRRIISMRKAHKHEKEGYHNALA